jgi:hypothetical protein
MRYVLALSLLLLASPALAQFPPPGIYPCTNADGAKLGTISLLVAGDYQWDANGVSATGQVASAGNSVEALTGPLGDQHWRGGFSDETGETVFVFETDIGTVTCN